MRIVIVNESHRGETRVAATPLTVRKFIELGLTVDVQSEAGLLAGFSDQYYAEAGATIVAADTLNSAEIVLRINQPDDNEIEALSPGQILVGMLSPRTCPEIIEKLSKKGVTALSLDMVPRISRAQSMDVLSSLANISGYRAVVEAAHAFGRFFAGQVTAAGKVPPAQVLVIGAGVAGLAAVGAAHSLGASVKAFDTRPEVAQQIQSMGGQFLALDFKEESGASDGYARVMSKAFIEAEMALFAKEALTTDIIICTAAIPGKRSPLLITEAMVKSMRAGSVIVDLAALGGGNCELTVPGEAITTENGVHIIGYTDLSARLAAQTSEMLGNNLVSLMKLLSKAGAEKGEVGIDFDDVIVRSMTITKSGEITYPPPAVEVSVAKPPQASAEPEKKTDKNATRRKKAVALAAKTLGAVALMALVGFIGLYAPARFIPHFTVFVLACVVGYYVVWNVSHSLHTPLMSVTNAISGIIVVGAMLQIGGDSWIVCSLAFIGILAAFINIVGGFAVTRRMLSMFTKRGDNQ